MKTPATDETPITELDTFFRHPSSPRAVAVFVCSGCGENVPSATLSREGLLCPRCLAERSPK